MHAHAYVCVCVRGWQTGLNMFIFNVKIESSALRGVELTYKASLGCAPNIGKFFPCSAVMRMLPHGCLEAPNSELHGCETPGAGNIPVHLLPWVLIARLLLRNGPQGHVQHLGPLVPGSEFPWGGRSRGRACASGSLPAYRRGEGQVFISPPPPGPGSPWGCPGRAGVARGMSCSPLSSCALGNTEAGETRGRSALWV